MPRAIPKPSPQLTDMRFVYKTRAKFRCRACRQKCSVKDANDDCDHVKAEPNLRESSESVARQSLRDLLRDDPRGFFTIMSKAESEYAVLVQAAAKEEAERESAEDVGTDRCLERIESILGEWEASRS